MLCSKSLHNHNTLKLEIDHNHNHHDATLHILNIVITMELVTIMKTYYSVFRWKILRE